VYAENDMSPSPSQLTININESSDLISQLAELLDIFPQEEIPANAVAWQNLEVGCEYWGKMTGFPSSSAPRRFTVREIWTFPDGGAMICTEDAAWAWGVGGPCESVIGPRNRFWRTDAQQI
jgi:hypothetical protein